MCHQIEEDAYQEDLGMSLGTLGKSKSGRVRGPLVDSKTKAKISKTLQQRMTKQQQVWGGSTTVKKQVAGTASSVAFTPLQVSDLDLRLLVCVLEMSELEY
jgi:U4/U6 small nuclear ribonucleoprotein PRP31